MLTEQVTNAELRKNVKIIIVSFLVFSIIFSMIFIYLWIQIYQEDNCGVNLYSDASINPDLTNDHTLNDATAYLLQEFDYETDENIGYYFCYNIIVNGTQGVLINIINEDETVLGKEYAYNGTEYYCTDLIMSDDSSNDYIGLKCDDCDTDNNVTIRSHILGHNTKKTYYDGTNTNTYYDNSAAYYLYGKKNCEVTFKWWLGLYYTLTGFYLIIMLMMIGFQGFIDFAKGWNK